MLPSLEESGISLDCKESVKVACLPSGSSEEYPDRTKPMGDPSADNSGLGHARTGRELFGTSFGTSFNAESLFGCMEGASDSVQPVGSSVRQTSIRIGK